MHAQCPTRSPRLAVPFSTRLPLLSSSLHPMVVVTATRFIITKIYMYSHLLCTVLLRTVEMGMYRQNNFNISQG